MRRIILSALSAGIFGICLYLQAGPAKNSDEPVKIRVVLLDSDSGKSVGGMIRVFRTGDDKPMVLAGLYDRLRGLKPTGTMAGWHVVPAGGGTVSLPKGNIKLEAVSGLETALLKQEVDLTGKAPEELALKLRPIFHPEKHNLAAGNTHLHLMNLTAEDADEYLKQIPAADRLKVMFISYLERVKEDATYITNRYPIGELKQFNAAGVLFNNGEEHRHNFGRSGQGYGHVMFLNIKQLVKPVSLGPGITGEGNDDRPLRAGIEEARKQDGTVIWCHNTFGYEGVSNTLAGRIDAFNVADGTRRDKYEDDYYRYLNIGQRLPISTGTDWFLYDFSRVYAKVSGELSVPRWLDAVKAGGCQVTNGPLLTITVDGKEPGDVLNLMQPKTARIEVSATGRHDFQILQLVHNGRVIQTESAVLKDGAYSARLVREVRLDEPAWFAARIDSIAKNELDQFLFAHTSPVYVDFDGQRPFDIETARLLQRRMEEARDAIRSRGKFGDEPARDKITAIYDDTVEELVKRINRRGK